MAIDVPLKEYPSKLEMDQTLAGVIAEKLQSALQRRGRAWLAVSGGSTPAGLYKALSEIDIDWPRVSAVLVDERWVAPRQEGSNETFIRDTLKRSKAEGLRLFGLWSDAPTARTGLELTKSRIDLPAAGFDCAVLGIGADGHTASWFPHADGLSDALSDVATFAEVTAIKSDVTGEHVNRITLTLGAIQQADFICLTFVGEEKRRVFEDALMDGAVEDMPVRAILSARPDLWACWTA